MMPNVTRGDRMAGLMTYLVGRVATTSTRSRTWWPAITRSWRGTTTPS
jgi:hypothetical protein